MIEMLASIALAKKKKKKKNKNLAQFNPSSLQLGKLIQCV